MRAASWALVAVLTAGALVGGSAAVKMTALNAERSELTADIAQLTAQVGSAEAVARELEERVHASERRNETLRLVLAERPAFVQAIDEAEKVFALAEGKVDVADQRAAVLAAQTAVLSERRDPAHVDELTEKIATLADDAEARLETWEAAARAARAQSRAGGAGSVSGGRGASDGWFAEMRGILNEVGGGRIALVAYDGWCGSVYSDACSVPGSIMVAPSIGSTSGSRKVWAMTHEYAHQVQFTVWDRIMQSPTYRGMFSSNIELLANCMASARGVTDHGGVCSGAMISWADGVWRGVVSN